LRHSFVTFDKLGTVRAKHSGIWSDMLHESSLMQMSHIFCNKEMRTNSEILK